MNQVQLLFGKKGVNMKIIVVFLLLSGCAEVGAIQPSPVDYAFGGCVNVGYSVARCENKEAVCYIGNGGISCFPKIR